MPIGWAPQSGDTHRSPSRGKALYGGDRIAFERSRRPAVHPDWHVSDQGDPVELAVEFRIENIPGSQVRGRAVVPERDTARGPAEAHRELGPHDVLPQELEHDLALASR